jgi:hypothetical protein
MTARTTNDLVDFMLSVQKQLAEEYKRIRKNSKNNASHAGNEGEANWAKILSDWLPSDYHIVTNVKLMNERGEISPEVDIAVLRPYYSKFLRDKKVVLKACVVAAFEVKNTLEANHISECFKKSIRIRNLFIEPLPFYSSSLLKGYQAEMYSPVIYGILAHSHSWKKKNSKPMEIINQKIYECDLQYVTSPKQMLDIVCVSDLALWSSLKRPLKMEARNGINNISWLHGPQTAYAQLDAEAHAKMIDPMSVPPFTPVGAMFCKLLSMMSITDERLYDLSVYFKQSGLSIAQLFQWRQWPDGFLSKQTKLVLDDIPNDIKTLMFFPTA